MLYVIGYCVVILKVAIGLGFVIFVHELGHFAVAKMCGVKCEKFYLGFDIGGLKLFKFRWGETEYGIGILPLGGYVKMLGQEDNPARLKEEIDRAKVANIHDAKTDEAQAALYDPRSFLSKNVPQRMAIISAGVIMNVIFAFLLAVVAFSMGVDLTPCTIGSVFPGDPAWQADIRPGDEVLEIAGKKMTQFRDLQAAITLGDIDPENGVPMLIRRPGVSEPFAILVKPDCSRGGFLIGVASGKTTQLVLDRKTWLVQKRHPVLPGTSAAKAEPAFQNGDRIVQIDDVPIKNYAQIRTELARKADRKIAITIEREANDANGKPQRLVIPVEPNPMRTLGLVMKMGEITALQKDSPALAAEIKPGDLICKTDTNVVADPMTLPEQLDAAAGKTVEVVIQREASKTPVIVPVRTRQPFDYAPPEIVGSPIEVASLGLAYRVLNRVDRVIEGSPAAKAGLQPEDLIVRAKLLPPDKATLRELQMDQQEIQIPFTETERNWPVFINTLQNVLPGTTVQLTVLRKDKEETVTLEPVKAADWFNPDRGLNLEPLTSDLKANGVGEAVALGAQETLDALTIVFRTVGKLSTNQVSPRNLGGPWMIIKMALLKADEGNAKLLLFLTMLSANLAVLNFLPIPLLDGGLMMFLIYEGIRGKPADERVQIVLTYIGLAFILGLMVWVIGLDFGLISRR